MCHLRAEMTHHDLMKIPRLSCAICRIPSSNPAPNVTMIMQARPTGVLRERLPGIEKRIPFCQRPWAGNDMVMPGCDEDREDIIAHVKDGSVAPADLQRGMTM